MTDRPSSDMIDFSYYPGCSMATTAKECSLSLIQACKYLGLNLIELDDWNCCGSSSAHCIDMELSFELAVRNLTLAPPHRPLVVMCPSCFRNLRQTKHHLAHSKKLHELVARRHLNPVADNLEIIHLGTRKKINMPKSRLNLGQIRPIRLSKTAGLAVLIRGFCD